ncbi:hypothetical protein D8Y22_08080 [Salinadaptatus halalkaliphilus]|uniref:Uncharacterized protein n=1 Tax=Salinadaptatus halalkaliphilus TaxID=2419781 RepID=A0A4V3VLC9_9EURY|nr:hypothetical protein D8Y22_08080 [Salinadaptatus halalkaliphilus]
MQSIWDAVADRVDDDLRAVVCYGPVESDSAVRDDIEDRYTVRDGRTVVDHTIVDQLRYKRHEDAVEAGSLTAVLKVFEDAWVVSCPDSFERKSGVLVSIDRNGSTEIDDIGWCLEYLENDVADLTPGDT